MIDNLIWQCESYNTTHRKAADQFAKEYWDRPRRVENFDDVELTFSVSDGTAVYLILHDLGKPGISVPTFKIHRT